MLSVSSCVMQCTKPLKKIPLIEIIISWPFHWPASSLTLLINILAAGQINWPVLSFLLLNWIAGIGIVFHCIYTTQYIHIFKTLNPKLKILKCNYIQIRHKACLSPFLITNWPQRHNLFHENPASTLRPPWLFAMPEISREINRVVQIPHPL